MPNLSNLSELVNRLRESEGGDANIDRALLETLGFQEDLEGKVVGGRGKHRAWFPPNGGDALISPRCTALMEDAIKVAKAMVGDRLSGVSWENGLASAQVEGGPFMQARTPQAAICLALLHDLALSGRLAPPNSSFE